MAVHGKYRQPCPVCGTAVQRIRYADNETNYCPRCQTEGRLLADRGLSRLLRSDWPRTIDELERLRRQIDGGCARTSRAGSGGSQIDRRRLDATRSRGLPSQACKSTEPQGLAAVPEAVDTWSSTMPVACMKA